MEEPQPNNHPTHEEPSQPKPPEGEAQPAEKSIFDQPTPPEEKPEAVLEEAEPTEARPAGSRAGRFFRAFLRWAVLVVVLFAAGVFTAYFVLYRPALTRADGLQTQLASAQQTQEVTQKSLKTAQDQAAGLQTQYAQAKADLDKANNQVALQMVLTDLANAKLALVNKDGPGAKVALMSAQTDLGKLLPAVKEKDSAMADAISARLSLVINELNRDPKTAQNDLDILAKNLQDLEKVLFP